MNTEKRTGMMIDVWNEAKRLADRPDISVTELGALPEDLKERYRHHYSHMFRIDLADRQGYVLVRRSVAGNLQVDWTRDGSNGSSVGSDALQNAVTKIVKGMTTIRTGPYFAETR